MKTTIGQLKRLLRETQAHGQVFLVFGYMGTGSASLTFPEDFDIVGVYHNQGVADAEAMRRNDEAKADGGSTDDDDDFEGMTYEVWPIAVLG